MNPEEIWYASHEYLATLDYLNEMFNDVIENTMGAEE